MKINHYHNKQELFTGGCHLTYDKMQRDSFQLFHNWIAIQLDL